MSAKVDGSKTIITIAVILVLERIKWAHATQC